MNQSAQSIKVLNSFFQSKYKARKLYELYCHNFPKQQALWKVLIRKKSGQLKILKDLLAKYNCANDLFLVNEYSLEIISYIENFIDRELDLIKRSRITTERALTTAIRLELSMLEKKSSEILTPLCARLEVLLNSISRDCGRQINFLTRALNKTA